MGCVCDHVSCAVCVCVCEVVCQFMAVFWPKSKYINMSLSSYESNCFCFFYSFIRSFVRFGSSQLFFGYLFFLFIMATMRAIWIHGPWNEKSNLVTMVYTQNDDKSAMSVTYHTWEREKYAQKMSCCFNEMWRTNIIFVFVFVCVCMMYIKLMQHDKGFRKGWNVNVASYSSNKYVS